MPIRLQNEFKEELECIFTGDQIEEMVLHLYNGILDPDVRHKQWYMEQIALSLGVTEEMISATGVERGVEPCDF